MPSLTHEALVGLFRDRPELVPSLIEGSLHVPLPAWSQVEVREASLTELAPAEYRADLVVLLRDGVPVFGVVLEVQLSENADKRFTWPVYATGLRARWRCPTAVLVVSPSPAVAAWAGAAIEVGPGSVFTPLVLGPSGVPRVTEGSAVPPELAILSALAHRDEPGGAETVLAALAAAASLDEERATFYYDLVLSGLSTAARAAPEALMNTHKHEYQSDFARKYFAEGKAEGRAEGIAKGKRDSLVTVLDARGLTVTPAQRERIEHTADIALLDRWFARAIRATSVDEVFAAGEG